MSAPDMEVIKEIPGYKVILKAVLKTQIQQLVEQLATHTDEESVILTASVSDGTLSHLGSDSGKGFLEDHEDVKSQFLGFCLKKHHKQKQAEQAEKAEKERERQQQLLESAQAMPVPTQLGYGFGYRRNPRGPFPRQNMPRPPGMPPGGGIRSPSQRFEPYPMHRPQRNSTSSDPGQHSMPTTPIKLEPSELSNDGVSDLNVTKSPHTSGLESKDDDKSNSSTSTIPTDHTEGAAGDKQQGDSDLDPNVSVKVEAITESEMELEITGVEPGRPIMPQNWDPNVSMGMTYDPNSGATGSPGDMQQSYNEYMDPTLEINLDNKTKRAQCELCGKYFQSKAKVDRHKLIHTGEKPFKCDVCGKSNHDEKFHYHVRCPLCGKVFASKQNKKRHMLVHSGARPFACEVCGKGFTQKAHMKNHMLVHVKSVLDQ